MTVDGQLRRQKLRRRLIRGVILTAASLPIMIVSIGKKWDVDHTISLTFTLAMMVVVLMYALSLKPDSKNKG